MRQEGKGGAARRPEGARIMGVLLAHIDQP